MLFRTLSALTFSLVSLAATAQAQDIALAKNAMRLYGGPSMDYPRIGLITWGQGVKVLGCRNDIDWCDIVADGQRGWVPGAKLTWPTSHRKPMSPEARMQVTI